ncbi:MAG: hypothetical protein ACK47M_24160, partial [Caldilinea sp.]
PLRNYDAMNTDQILERCVLRNVKDYMSLTREQQIAALRDLDAQEDAKAKADGAQPRAKVKASV